MRAKLIVLAVLIVTWHKVIEAAPVSNKTNLRLLLQELDKSAPPVAQQLSRRVRKGKEKNLINAIEQVDRPLSFFKSVNMLIGPEGYSLYKEKIYPLVIEAIKLDAVKAFKIGDDRADMGSRADDARWWAQLEYSGDALKVAAEHNSLRIAKILLKKLIKEGKWQHRDDIRVEIGAADINDAFVVAAQHDNVAIMKLLTKYGAYVSTEAIEQAAANKSVAALRFLTRYSSEEEIITAVLRHDDSDALQHIAAEIKQTLFLAETDLGHAIVTYAGVEEIEELLAKGVDVNSKDASGDSPLAKASLLGKWRLVAILIDAGADVNAQGNHGRTALHQALRLRHHEVAALLLNRGADPKITDDIGISPEMLARELNDSTLLALIEQAKQQSF